MRVLLLVQRDQRIILDTYYEAIARECSKCDVVKVSSEEQSNLKKYFVENINQKDYDRIILFLRFKKEIKQWRFIQSIENLVILEHDAYQNYVEFCKYKNRFSEHYKRMPWVRILVSGYKLSRRLHSEGFDAVFIPKGYDQENLYDMGLTRDIDLAFVGSLKSGVYQKRKELLEEIRAKHGLEIIRTASGREYLETFNKIKFFVNADVGMGEYMIKNFEAMACGCLLITWSQGEEEGNALGFKDMENVVLFNSVAEFEGKLSKLSRDPVLVGKIARAGRLLVEERFQWQAIARDLVLALKPPLRVPKINKTLGVFKKYGYGSGRVEASGSVDTDFS